jgi:AcrR family transcriptional regulator
MEIRLLPQDKSRPAPSARQARTRRALLEAAVALLDEGRAPTVTDVAERAEVGRATAYRHFPSNERLQSEAALDRVARTAVAMRLPQDAPTPEAAAEALVDRVLDMVIANEEAFRLMLRNAMEPDAGARGARRIDWARQVLGPWRDDLAPAAFDRLVAQLALLLGIETVVALCDVAGLTHDEARRVARDAARALVAAARL